MRCGRQPLAAALLLMLLWVVGVQLAHIGVRVPRRGVRGTWAASMKPTPESEMSPEGAPTPPPAGQAHRSTSNAALRRNRTFDDIIACEVAREKYTYPAEAPTPPVHRHCSGAASSAWSPCDDVSIPFRADGDRECIRFLARALASAASRGPAGDGGGESASTPLVAFAFGGRWSVCAAVDVQPMEQRFEQRTIKFKATISFRATPMAADAAAASAGECTVELASADSVAACHAPARVAAILKVPQMLFQAEPFSEVAAFAADRALRINRIPPTALLQLPLAWLQGVAANRRKRSVHMVPDFLRASNVRSYDEWITHDFVDFVRHAQRGSISGGGSGEEARPNSFMGNSTHVYVSAQLVVREVQPLLSSVLRVPYSKATPGWHRWFNPDNHAYDGHLQGSLLALSELAVFDFLTVNNDRSPNKNNFVVGGCTKCGASDRRPSGMPPTFVHIDQGMAFYGGGQHLVHNPLGKPADKVSFCIFYRPLIESLRLLDKDVWEAKMRLLVPQPALRVLGRSRIIEGVLKQAQKVLSRVDVCLRQFPESVVLRP